MCGTNRESELRIVSGTNRESELIMSGTNLGSYTLVVSFCYIGFGSVTSVSSLLHLPKNYIISMLGQIYVHRFAARSRFLLINYI